MNHPNITYAEKYTKDAWNFQFSNKLSKNVQVVNQINATGLSYIVVVIRNYFN